MTNNYSLWVGQLQQAVEVLACANNKSNPSVDLLCVLRDVALDAKCTIEAVMKNLDGELEHE